jgi:hypothetical protein
MAKASASRSASIPVPVLPAKRQSIRRDEVITIAQLMDDLGIKDRRTAIKLLRGLGLSVDPIAGVVLISGESFFKAVTNRGGADS